ncbi:MAG TPA: hypothetical protein VK934_10515 [Fimbriimonas sp.]|nr:hypothetical protein [Fimbriimonas sp.]
MDAVVAVRLKVLRLAVCSGLLSAMALCPRLWTSDRSFPTISALPIGPLPSWLTLALTGGFVVSLLTVAIGKWQRESIILALGTALLLVLFDVNRLQPWMFQYLLLLFALLAKPSLAWRYCGLIVACTYFWSGLQKVNLAFGNEIFPWLISSSVGTPLLGLTAALLEGAIGVLLLVPRGRKVALAGAVVLHLFVLMLLGPLGHNFNAVVWPWNFCLPAISAALFFRNDEPLFPEVLQRAVGRTLFVLVAVLPGLSLFGLWDDNLSSSLYSGRVRNALLKVPPGHDPDGIVDVTAWALEDLGVPPYPAIRVYRSLAQKIPGAKLFVSDRTLWGGAGKNFSVP